MSAGHAPGPWTLVEGQSWPFKHGERNEIIAHLEQQVANARLIAAAHDLLVLAYQYRNDLRYPPSDDSRERRIAAIDAVIAKATGEKK